MGIFLLPIIAVKTKFALGTEYYKGDKKVKAKSNFVAFSTFLPAILSFLSTYYYSNMSFLDIRFLLAAGFFSYIYLNSIFIFFFRKKNKEKNTHNIGIEKDARYLAPLIPGVRKR